MITTDVLELQRLQMREVLHVEYLAQYVAQRTEFIERFPEPSSSPIFPEVVGVLLRHFFPLFFCAARCPWL